MFSVRSRPRALVAASAVATTAAAVAVGVVVVDAPAPAPAPAEASGSLADAAADISALTEEDRSVGTSRSVERGAVLKLRVPEVERTLWTTAPLKLRTQPREKTRSVGTFGEDEKIGVTGKRRGGYAEVVVDKRARWVTASYLSKKKERETGSAAGLNVGSCPNGASASGGLQPSAQLVLNAVCNAFPQITTYGGYAPRGEHGGGLAIDVMVTGSLGDQVKEFLYANRGELNLSNVIWAQSIWSAARDGEGFRAMEDRGSTTLNHFDNLHVLVN